MSTFVSVIHTFAIPIILKVGSSPRENINRRIVAPMNVRIPEGLGKVTIITNDMNMAAQTKPDSRGSSSAKQQKYRESLMFEVVVDVKM